MSRSTSHDCNVSTYPLNFSQAIADKTANTFLIPNPVVSSSGTNKEVCEIYGMQILWDQVPASFNATAIGTASNLETIHVCSTFDTAVTYKDKAVDGTSSTVMMQNLESSPSMLGILVKRQTLITGAGTTTGQIYVEDANMWDSSDWVLQFGRPNDPNDGELWVTPSGILTFGWALTTNTTKNTPKAVMKLFWKPRKITLQKFLEISASQSRQLVTTVA
jgi:hypothetical protein